MDTIRSAFKGSAVTGLALCAFLGAAIYSKDAHAVDNLCLPTLQMKQHLNNMGQYSLIAFEHKGSDSKKKFVFRAIYSTNDGKQATEVFGVTARDQNLKEGQLQTPETLCIEDTYTDVQLTLNNQRTIPTSFLERDVSTKDALEICDKRKWGDYCAAHNSEYLHNYIARTGRYPMLRMTVADFDKFGQVIRLGLNKTVIADPDTKGEMRGIVEDSIDGVGQTAYIISAATYTIDGLKALEQNWPLVVKNTAPNKVASGEQSLSVR